MKAISSLKRLGAYIKPYKVQFILVLLFTVATVGFNAAMPYVSGLPTTEISRNIAAGEGVNFDYVILCLIWIAVVGVGYCFSQLMSGLLITNVVQSAMRDLRQDIEEKINRLPVSYFDRNQQGNILSRVTNDVDAVSGAMQQALIGIVNAFLGIVMAVSMMFYINTYMALVSLIMIPASLLISRTIVKKSQKDFQGMQNALGDLNGYVQENMTGFSVLKVYGREKQTLEGFKNVNHQLRYYGFRSAFVSGLMMPLVQMTAYFTYIAMAVMGSFYVISGVIVVGQLQAFIQYIWQVSQPMGNITQLSSVLQSASAAAKRVFEILDEEEEPVNQTDIQLPEQIRGDVTFEHVGFAYDPKKPLIKDLNFEVKAGQTVAIVGPTGAGKTTLINLLMRFYDVNEGSVKVDGMDVRDVTLESLRSQMGVMLQDTFIFSGTIIENIRYGKLDATEEEIIEAAKIVRAHDFITELKDGYQTVVEERGSTLSAGQRQLISFARALLADPKILILDEATSSIDTKTEELLQEGLLKLLEGRTSFIIAHRLSTIKNSDRIFYVAGGTIAESGNHDQLMAQKGLYHHLYQSQYDLLQAI